MTDPEGSRSDERPPEDLPSRLLDDPSGGAPETESILDQPVGEVPDRGEGRDSAGVRHEDDADPLAVAVTAKEPPPPELPSWLLDPLRLDDLPEPPDAAAAAEPPPPLPEADADAAVVVVEPEAPGPEGPVAPELPGWPLDPLRLDDEGDEGEVGRPVGEPAEPAPERTGGDDGRNPPLIASSSAEAEAVAPVAPELPGWPLDSLRLDDEAAVDDAPGAAGGDEAGTTGGEPAAEAAGKSLETVILPEPPVPEARVGEPVAEAAGESLETVILPEPPVPEARVGEPVAETEAPGESPERTGGDDGRNPPLIASSSAEAEAVAPVAPELPGWPLDSLRLDDEAAVDDAPGAAGGDEAGTTVGEPVSEAAGESLETVILSERPAPEAGTTVGEPVAEAAGESPERTGGDDGRNPPLIASSSAEPVAPVAPVDAASAELPGWPLDSLRLDDEAAVDDAPGAAGGDEAGTTVGEAAEREAEAAGESPDRTGGLGAGAPVDAASADLPGWPLDALRLDDEQAATADAAPETTVDEGPATERPATEAAADAGPVPASGPAPQPRVSPRGRTPGRLVDGAGTVQRVRAVVTLAVVLALASAGLAAVIAIAVAAVAIVIRRAAGG